ncbi:MAG TPA: hypothetical protein VGH74_01965 [Planctomycetaceae bacterium]|jgi:hypothetical protein
MPETPRTSKPAAKSSSRPAAKHSEAPRLPPRIVKKKKKPIQRETAVEPDGREAADPPSELLVPVIVIVVSLVINVGTSLVLRPESVPAGLWLGIRMAIIVASSVITYGALFLAAQALDVEYGYITTGAVKVAAITLTQAWVGDLATKIPVPFVDWLFTFGTTYAMFKYFFGLDDMEALASMAVVRLVHWLVIAFLFIAIMSAIMGGKNIDLSLPAQALAPAAAGAGADADVEGPDEDDGPEP